MDSFLDFIKANNRVKTNINITNKESNMSQFTTALVVSPLSDGKSWVILDNFEYHVGTENSDDRVIALKGFVTDFTSVPRIFWWVIPRWGKYGNAAVIHDWLYWKQGDKDRKESDYILLEAMTVLGVSKWKKKLIFLAVRWFGWIAWSSNFADRESGYERIINTKRIKAILSSERVDTIKSAYSYYLNKMYKKKE